MSVGMGKLAGRQGDRGGGEELCVRVRVCVWCQATQTAPAQSGMYCTEEHRMLGGVASGINTQKFAAFEYNQRKPKSNEKTKNRKKEKKRKKKKKKKEK